MPTITDNSNDPLVPGEPLPASSTTFVDVKEDTMKVFYGENDLDEFMKSIKDNFWQDSNDLRAKFKIPPGTLSTRQKKARLVDSVFPYCLVQSAQTLRERLIVINWWLNLSKDEQKAKKAFLKEKFERPGASTKWIYEYDSNNNRYTGIADSLDKRQRHADNSRSHEILHGGTRRTSAYAPAKSDRQLRDNAVRTQQAVVERSTRELCNWTAVDTEHADNVRGYFHPMSMHLHNIFSPQVRGTSKRGRPTKKVRDTIASSPMVAQFTRNEASLEAYAANMANRLDRVTNGRSNVTAADMLAAYKYKAKTYYAEDKETKWPSDILQEAQANREGTVPKIAEEEAGEVHDFSADDF